MDYDIAMHTVIVRDLDRNLPIDKATAIIDEIFNELFPGGKVITTKVLGKMEMLYAMAKELRELKKKHRYYWNLNKKGANEPGFERKTLKKRKNCFMGTLKYDAEDYF
jgi:hypothetical protein